MADGPMQILSFGFKCYPEGLQSLPLTLICSAAGLFKGINVTTPFELISNLQ